jgi:hypothetical protein
MVTNQWATEKSSAREQFPLHFPRAGNLADPKNLWFEWAPPQTKRKDIWYRLLVYPLRPRQTLAQVVKGKPVYTVDKLKTPYHQYPENAKALDPGGAYCWRVEARDEANRLIGGSAIQGFRFRLPRAYTLLDTGLVAHAPRWSDFLPVPPIIWGCPVRLRTVSSLPEEAPSPAPGEPGTVDPLAFTLWGSEAARLYLIPSLVRHASLRWDYSHISGCSQVLLQTAGEAGFEIPNAADARTDSGVRSSYLGPVAVGPPVACGAYEPNLESGSRFYSAYDLNLQRSEHDLLTLWSDYLYVRLAPLDAAGDQIAPASDHVSVHCVAYPTIALGSCSVEWLWGENPRRRIHFTIQLRTRFPSTLIFGTVDDAPATLIISGGTLNLTVRSWNPILENVSLAEADGTPVTTLATWYGVSSYFKVIDQWCEGNCYSFTLEQSNPRAPFTSSLLAFTELRLYVECIPGLRPTWPICAGRLLDGDRPPIGAAEEGVCEPTMLSAQWEESGLGPIFRLFILPLTGRRVSSRDGAQVVQVRFEFPVVIADAEAFRNFLLRNTAFVSFTMVETIDGSSRTYEFRLSGFHAEMYFPEFPGERYGGATRSEAGRLVYDPPHLEMHFQCDRSHWISEEGRWVEDIETVDYYLST